MLALGVLIGAPWLVNSALAGLNILLTFAFIREIYHARAGRLAALLLCVSPWYVFMAMNFMTHTFTLTCALLAALGLAWARRTGKVTWGVVSGMAIGMVSLIRPLEGFVLAGLLGLWAIGVGGQRLKVSSIAAIVLGAAVVGGLVLPYNKFFTGSPAKFPIMAYTDKYYGPNRNAMGFGPDRGLGWELDPFPGHGIKDALVNSELNAFSVNIELFGWLTGSLFILACLLFSGSIFSTALSRSDCLMLATISAVFVAHIFYWYSGGPDFGARYWYLMLIPCVALTVRGIEFLHRKIEAGGGNDTSNRDRVNIFVLSLCLLTLVNYFPWRAIDKYHNYLGMRPDIRRLDKEYNFGKSLVLIRGNRHPDYASAAIYNPIDLHADAPVYAWDRDAKTRKQALTAYRDRQVWIVDGPTITHGGFKMVDGPLSAQKLLDMDLEPSSQVMR
jgi:4-amino-4-deoxy-L-arabinose transferase-like glycosyltransferase